MNISLIIWEKGTQISPFHTQKKIEKQASPTHIT